MINIIYRLGMLGLGKMIRALANIIILIAAFGLAVEKFETLSDWVDSTPVYNITIESYSKDNILDGDIRQFGIQPVKAVANAGMLLYMAAENYINSNWGGL